MTARQNSLSGRTPPLIQGIIWRVDFAGRQLSIAQWPLVVVMLLGRQPMVVHTAACTWIFNVCRGNFSATACKVGRDGGELWDQRIAYKGTEHANRASTPARCDFCNVIENIFKYIYPLNSLTQSWNKNFRKKKLSPSPSKTARKWYICVF